MKGITIILCCFYFSSVQSQISSVDLLENSIQYHDPHGHWPNFKAALNISTENKSGVLDEIRIHMNHLDGSFRFEKQIEAGVFGGYILLDSFSYTLNGDPIQSNSLLNNLVEANESVHFFRDYYAYLWGLPMKLTDKEAVKSTYALPDQFFGKSVYRMRVTYPNQVGPKVWYFYFNKKNFALEGIQFYYNEALMDGETILLNGEKTIDEIRFSKERTWYSNRYQSRISKEVLR